MVIQLCFYSPSYSGNKLWTFGGCGLGKIPVNNSAGTSMVPCLYIYIEQDYERFSEIFFIPKITPSRRKVTSAELEREVNK